MVGIGLLLLNLGGSGSFSIRNCWEGDVFVKKCVGVSCFHENCVGVGRFG